MSEPSVHWGDGKGGPFTLCGLEIDGVNVLETDVTVGTHLPDCPRCIALELECREREEAMP